MHYLDNAATTKVAPEVIEEITVALSTHYANPSSLYEQGLIAEQAISSARKTLADALGCTAPEVHFTGSGTEASNIAILGMARARKAWGQHLVATGYEHPCVAKPLEMLAVQEGFRVTFVPPTPDGRVNIDELVAEVGSDTALLCAMHVNNETGAKLDVKKLAALVKKANPRTAVHVDGVQGFTKLPLTLSATQIDSYAISGHKLHAPKGVGALYLRRGLHVLPPLLGGGQEQGVRPGTENTAYIIGLATAVQLALSRQTATQCRVKELREQLLAGLCSLAGVAINSPADAYSGILNFSLPEVLSETMLHFLEEKKIYVSSGSACTKGQASHTLSAMRLPTSRIEGALRVSFCGQNTPADVEALLAGLKAGLEGLARPAKA